MVLFSICNFGIKSLGVERIKVAKISEKMQGGCSGRERHRHKFPEQLSELCLS